MSQPGPITRARCITPIWLLVSGASLAACASSAVHTPPAASATTTFSTSAAGPENAAIQYTKDVATHDTTAARTFMAPDSVAAFDRIYAVSPQSAPGSSQHLGVGHVTRTPNRADVLLTGTLCPPTNKTLCITNTSSTTSRANLPFVVHLEHAGTRWLVTFPRPNRK
jgi:hypothetical protein